MSPLVAGLPWLPWLSGLPWLCWLPWLSGLPAAAGDPVDRTVAREAAQRELSKAIYHRNDPSLLARIAAAVLRWLLRVLQAAAGAAPGGALGLVALVVLVAIAVVVLRLRVGPLLVGARVPAGPLAAVRPLTPEEHRRAADRFAAEGRWAEAVRERLRAVAGELEARGVLDPRPGRTADEVAAEAGARLPALAPRLRGAARMFDEVWYGGRPATPEAESGLRELDDAVRRGGGAVSVGAATEPAAGRGGGTAAAP